MPNNNRERCVSKVLWLGTVAGVFRIRNSRYELGALWLRGVALGIAGSTLTIVNTLPK